MDYLWKLGSSFFALSFVFLPSIYGEGADGNSPFERPHAHEVLEGSAQVGWESRYLSEGRDSLDGDSLLTSAVELGWQHVAAGVWFGASPDQSYDELQLSLALSQSFDTFEFYVGYTHLRFPFESSHDNEVGAGFAWSGLPWEAELAVDVYYSFDADGYFAEIGGSREFEVTEKLGLTVSGIFGTNQGYVSDGHDGANHFALSCGIDYALSDSVSVTTHASYSWGLESDASLPGDDQLIDFFHAGVGVQWSF